MEYLLVDSHQRFLGTLNYTEALSVGDVFQNEERTYAVVGKNWANQQTARLQSLTVVRVNSRPRKAAPESIH